MEIDVSTADELPADGVIYGVKARHGSIAHCVQTGEFYSWDGAAEGWYNQDGSDAPAPNTAQTTQAAPLNMVSPTVVRPQTQLNTIQENETDDIEEVTEDASVRGAESE
jgi:hypothetical protein